MPKRAGMSNRERTATGCRLIRRPHSNPDKNESFISFRTRNIQTVYNGKDRRPYCIVDVFLEVEWCFVNAPNEVPRVIELNGAMVHFALFGVELLPEDSATITPPLTIRLYTKYRVPTHDFVYRRAYGPARVKGRTATEEIAGRC